MKLSEAFPIRESGKVFETEVEKKAYMMEIIKATNLEEEAHKAVEQDLYSFPKGEILNIGCGNKKKDGWVNIDKRESCNPDIVADIEKGLKFAENSIDGIYASNILEHVKDLVSIMEDMYKVCKPDAKIIIIVPHYKSHHAFDDPTHCRFFTENTFQYFSQEHRERNKCLFDYDFKCNFEMVHHEINDEGIMTVILKVKKEDKNGRKSKERSTK